MMIDFMIYAICTCGILCCLWGGWRNELTYRDRKKILEKVHSLHGDAYWKYARLFDSVSYDSHHRARVFCRDWRALYPRELIELLDGGK